MDFECCLRNWNWNWICIEEAKGILSSSEIRIYLKIFTLAMGVESYMYMF